jgi:hypothetical protein
MRALLWLRGFRGRNPLAEAADLALHLLEVRLWLAGAPITEHRARQRAVLDGVVYDVERELRPVRLQRPRRLRNGDEPARLDIAERARLVDNAIELLPVARRLVCKLKLADHFYPGWDIREIAWRVDEEAHLLALHGGRSLVS